MTQDELHDLMDSMPVNLLITPILELSENTIIIKVVKREVFNEPKDGLTCIDFHILKSNVKDVAVVCVVDYSKGMYALTIRKNTNKIPIDLEPGDYVEFNIMQGFINEVLYASGMIRFEK